MSAKDDVGDLGKRLKCTDCGQMRVIKVLTSRGARLYAKCAGKRARSYRR